MFYYVSGLLVLRLWDAELYDTLDYTEYLVLLPT